VLLPNSKTSEESVVKKQISLAITADHKYYLNKKEITFEEIQPKLAAMLKDKTKKEQLIVLLQADKSLNLQDVVNVIDIGNQLNVKMVLFTHKKK